MTDPRYNPANDDPSQDPAEGSRDDEDVQPDPDQTETDTHSAALQGAAGGGALTGNVGYAGGVGTGSSSGIGMRDILTNQADEAHSEGRDAEEDAD